MEQLGRHALAAEVGLSELATFRFLWSSLDGLYWRRARHCLLPLPSVVPERGDNVFHASLVVVHICCAFCLFQHTYLDSALSPFCLVCVS